MSDWDSVTILRKRKTSQDTRSKQAVSSALATGNVEISKKQNISNKKANISGNIHKIEEETEDFSIKTINPSISKIISQARQSQGMTQKDLSHKINEKLTVVNEYESGKAMPNQAILVKFERVLNVKLRGSANEIGKPLLSK
jgi:putative transcription factor